VQLLGHLTHEEIRRHVAGLPSTDVDRHVRLCVCCAQQLADAAMRAVWWERRGRLRRLVRVDNSQAVDQLLAEIAREQRRDAA